MQQLKPKQHMEYVVSKVWINKGEILSKDPYASEKKQVEQGSVR